MNLRNPKNLQIPQSLQNQRSRKFIKSSIPILGWLSFILLIIFFAFSPEQSKAGIYFNDSVTSSHDLTAINATNADFSDSSAPEIFYAFLASGGVTTSDGRFRIVNDGDKNIFTEATADTSTYMVFYVSWTDTSATSATLKVNDATNGDFDLITDCSGSEEEDCGSSTNTYVTGTKNGSGYIFNFAIKVEEFCNNTSSDDLDNLCNTTGTYDSIEGTSVSFEAYDSSNASGDASETLSVKIYFSDNGPSSGVSVAAGRGDGQIYLDTTTASVSSSDEPDDLSVIYSEAVLTCAESEFVSNELRNFDYSDDDFYELELTGLTNGTTYSGCVALTNKALMVGYSGASLFTNVTPSEVSGLLEESHCFIATSAWGSPDREPVLALREFRDFVLKTFSLGRGLVEIYYKYSPAIADEIIVRPELRKIVRTALTPFYWMSIPASKVGGVGGFFVFMLFFAIGIFLTFFAAFMAYKIFTSENKKVRISVFIFMLIFSGLILRPVFAQSDSDEGVEHGAIGGPGEDMAVQPAADPNEASLPFEPSVDADFSDSSENFRNQDYDLDDSEITENSLGGYGSTTGKSSSETSKRSEAYEALKKRDNNKDRNPHWIPQVQRKGRAKLKFEEIKGKRTKSTAVLHEELGEKISSGFNITFTTAPVKPKLSESAKANDFDTIYSEDRYGVFFGLDKNIAKGVWGTFGWNANGGVTYSRGYGRFDDNEVMNRFSFRFWTFPMSLGVSYRFHPLKYVIPFAEAGALGFAYRETRDDKVNDTKSGLSYGSRLSAGLQIALDWIDFSQSWEGYTSHDIRRHYLIASMTNYNATSGITKKFKSDSNPVKFQDTQFEVGFRMEF